MPIIQKTPQAEDDLLEIWWHIAQDNVSAADALIRKLNETFELLAHFPKMGTEHPEFGEKLRGFPFRNGNYVIFFVPLSDEKGIELIHILHAARDRDNILNT